MPTVDQTRRQEQVIDDARAEATVITDQNDRTDYPQGSTETSVLGAVERTAAEDPKVRERAHSALTAFESGRLNEASSWASIGLQEVSDSDIDRSSEVAQLHRTLSAVLLEWFDVQRALTHALASIRELTTQPPSQLQMHAFLQMAVTSAAAGQSADALVHLDEARRMALTSSLDSDAQDRLMRDHVAILLDVGEIEQAHHWLAGLRQHVSLAVEDEALSLRALVAEGIDEGVGDRAIRLLKGVPGDASLRTRIEVGVASAVALDAADRRNEASVILSTTLQLGEPERFVWTLARYKESIRPLLQIVRESGPQGRQLWGQAYVDRIMRAAETTPFQYAGRNAGENTKPNEPLSERELQVLRLLSGTLSNREIGAELYLSVNTVKTHVKSVYAKLGVNRRAEAVNRAKELGLLRNHSNVR